MPVTPSKPKQSRTHQSSVQLPPCRDLINQADAIMFSHACHRGVMPPAGPPQIPALNQRAPGQAPYSRSDRTKSIPRSQPANVMMPHPNTTAMPRAVTLHHTQGNSNPPLRAFIVATEEDYKAFMNQPSSSVGAAAKSGKVQVHMRRAAPISESPRKHDRTNAVQTKGASEHGKVAGKTQRFVGS